MKRYESYKDSGIEWLGMIPSHWKVCKVKNLCSDIFAGGTPPTSIPTYWDGQIPWIPSGCCHDCNIDNAPKTITEEGLNNSSTRLIPANTTVMAMTGATCSFVGYLTFRACANQSVTAFIPKLNKIDSRFLFYLLQGMRKYILTFQTGGAQGGINVNDCQNLIIPHIPFEEQQIIAFYLDDKVGQIDAVITEKEKMVEDLQNYRKSVISEAVTRGLNPDVPMKNSGIDKFPQIPSYWNSIKLKYMSTICSGGALPSDQLRNDGEYEVYGGNGCMGRTSHYNTEAPAIIIGRVGALCGNIHLINSPKWVTDNALVLVVNGDTSYEYIAYYLQAYDLNTLNSSNAQPLITGTKVLNVQIPVPPLEEQNKIVDYLNNRYLTMDATISELQSQIEDLKSYKSSLITEAVTGKIDLR